MCPFIHYMSLSVVVMVTACFSFDCKMMESVHVLYIV